MTAGSTSGGAVYDRGYRPYDGPMGGRGHARWALFRMTVRRAVGLRRSWRQKVMPWLLLAMTTVPAVVNVGIKFAIGDDTFDGEEIEFIRAQDYFEVTLLLMLLFVAVTAPDAVCPDRRQKTLSLVFSRPLDGIDYVLAKLGAVATVVFCFALLPQVVLFAGQAIVDDNGAMDYLGENAEVLWQVPLTAAVIAAYVAVIGVAVSSLTDRRIIGGIAVLGLWLVSTVTAGILVFSGKDTVDGELGYADGSAFALLDVFGIPLFLRDVIFLGHIDPFSALGGVADAGILALLVYVGVLALGSGVLIWRYRQVKL
jgi:ABC-2 type transport system permease protein